MAAPNAGKGRVGDEILKRIFTLAFPRNSALIQDPRKWTDQEQFFRSCSKVRTRTLASADGQVSQHWLDLLNALPARNHTVDFIGVDDANEIVGYIRNGVIPAAQVKILTVDDPYHCDSGILRDEAMDAEEDGTMETVYEALQRAVEHVMRLCPKLEAIRISTFNVVPTHADWPDRVMLSWLEIEAGPSEAIEFANQSASLTSIALLQGPSSAFLSSGSSSLFNASASGRLRHIQLGRRPGGFDAYDMQGGGYATWRPVCEDGVLMTALEELRLYASGYGRSDGAGATAAERLFGKRGATMPTLRRLLLGVAYNFDGRDMHEVLEAVPDSIVHIKLDLALETKPSRWNNETPSSDNIAGIITELALFIGSQPGVGFGGFAVIRFDPGGAAPRRLAAWKRLTILLPPVPHHARAVEVAIDHLRGACLNAGVRLEIDTVLPPGALSNFHW